MEQSNRAQLTYTAQGLCIEGIAFKKLIQDFGSPFYLYSQNILSTNYLEYETWARNHGLDATICFALKANANPHVLNTLAKLGAGADIVSGGELTLALKAGIPASKIVFSGVGKTLQEIDQAIDADIYSFNVESLEELQLISARAYKKQKIANIAFRLNPKVIAKTHKHISTGFKTHKFGMVESDILATLKDQSLWKNCKLRGLSVHIGSQLTCLDATSEAIAVACNLIKKLPPLEFIDVGGGLGVSYNPSEKKAPSVEEYMSVVARTLKTHAINLKVVFEPGRRICASCGFFITSVLRTKKSEECNFLIVDGGMNDFVRPSLYDAFHEIYPGRLDSEIIETDIVGPICETADCFGQARKLPKLHQGDFIVIADTGAYGQTMSSRYNQRPPIREYFIDSSLHILA